MDTTNNPKLDDSTAMTDTPQGERSVIANSWLSQPEEYVPSNTKSSGLLHSEKTIKKLLVRLQEGETKISKKHRIHPAVSLISLIVVLFILSYTSSIYVVWIAGIVEIIVILARLTGISIVKVLKTSFWLLIFNAILYVPSIFLHTFNWVFMVKTSLILIATAGYAINTSVFDFLSALKQLHAPRFFIFQFDIFVKNLHVLGLRLLLMLHAVECRTVGDARSQRKLWGVLVGNLYLQMVELGKEMYDALEARAFNDKYPYMVHKMNGTDYAIIVFEVLAIIGVVVLQTHLR